MCGRFSISITKKEIRTFLNDAYDIEEFDDDIMLPRYNVAPGQDVISVINDGKRNRAGLMHWGFVPSFAKDEKIGFSMINAKSETLGEKPSFYPSFKTKRCVILADGFYEWKKEQKQKTPMRIVLKDQKIFPMAGLWSTYQRSDGSKFFTCTIITTSANDLMTSIHDRMPVILTEENQKVWLNPRNTDLDMLSKVLVPYDSTKMHAYLVSNLVNKASNDLYECIQPIEKA